MPQLSGTKQPLSTAGRSWDGRSGYAIVFATVESIGKKISRAVCACASQRQLQRIARVSRKDHRIVGKLSYLEGDLERSVRLVARWLRRLRLFFSS